MAPSHPLSQTLHTLLPTLSHLPPELLHLSTSLLSQSRTKAPTLKPEEEIARTYACCHIACQRLGHKLALEIADPVAPPVKPRVYAKLHAFFGSVLASPRKGAQRSGDAVGVGEVGKGGRAEVTPVKEKDGRPALSSSTGKRAAPAATAPLRGASEEVEVPRYIMPMIKHLCTTFSTPSAAPHVLSGVETVIPRRGWGEEDQRSIKKRRTNAENDTNTFVRREDPPTVIIALFLVVVEKMYPSEQTPTKQKEEGERISRAVKSAQEYCAANPKGLPPARDVQEPLERKVGRIKSKHLAAWKGMEWYQEIPIMSSNDPAEGSSEEDIANETPKRPAKTPLRRAEKHGKKAMEVDGEEEVGAAGLLPGLATMFQPALDWLGDERRAHYEQWRRDIMGEIDRMVAV